VSSSSACRGLISPQLPHSRFRSISRKETIFFAKATTVKDFMSCRGARSTCIASVRRGKSRGSMYFVPSNRLLERRLGLRGGSPPVGAPPSRRPFFWEQKTTFWSLFVGRRYSRSVYFVSWV